MVTGDFRLNMPFVGISRFCRFPVCHDLDTLDADIAVLGVPHEEGASFRTGMRFAPRRIRDMSMHYGARGGKATGSPMTICAASWPSSPRMHRSSAST